MHTPWDLRLFVTLAAATAATPVFGQTIGSAVGSSNSASQRASSVPDFSGIWGYLFCCGFEQPPSGPGPVTNRTRLRTGPQIGVSSQFQFVGEYTNPILKPEAADVVKKFGDVELKGEPHGTPRNQCWPEGVPFVFSNHGMLMIQQPHQITILYDEDHQVRHIRMNEPHSARVTPSWYGESIGHYEGDTLVIDTIGIKRGPFAMIDWFGTPYTGALHVVERYRLLDYEATQAAEERGERELVHQQASSGGFARNPEYKGKGLQLQFTVEDSGVFTMPWTAMINYRRPLGGWPEVVCAESIQWYPGTNAAAPAADKPDF
jgi:hypothetical protein